MESILELLKTEPVAILPPQDLEHLLQKGEVLQEVDTQISDLIRIIITGRG